MRAGAAGLFPMATVVRRQRLTPPNAIITTRCHADQRPNGALNNALTDIRLYRLSVRPVVLRGHACLHLQMQATKNHLHRESDTP